MYYTITEFDLDEEEMRNYFEILKKTSSSSIKFSDLLEKYKHNGDFINLCKMIKAQIKFELEKKLPYVSPMIIPILEELDINEDILHLLVSRWLKCDDEDKYIAYNLINKNCPRLIVKLIDYIYESDAINVKGFRFNFSVYVKDFIKILTDLNHKDCKIEFKLVLRPLNVSENNNGVKFIVFEGNPYEAIQKMITEYLLSDICQIHYFNIDGENSIGEIPFCYFFFE